MSDGKARSLATNLGGYALGIAFIAAVSVYGWTWVWVLFGVLVLLAQLREISHQR